MTSLNGATLKEQVYATVMHNLIDGSYNVESVLSEKKLSEQLNVSKAPVREALVELCAQGDDLIQQDLFHDRSPLRSARRGAWFRARKGGSRRKAVPRWMRAVFYRL